SPNECDGDSTVIRAHHHAAGAVWGKETSSGRFDPITATPKEAPGRSRGGFSTRSHLRVNGAGLPTRTEITPGQVSDYTGHDLVMADNLPQPAVLVADRSYDSDKVREDIGRRHALPFVGKTVPRTVI